MAGVAGDALSEDAPALVADADVPLPKKERIMLFFMVSLLTECVAPLLVELDATLSPTADGAVGAVELATTRLASMLVAVAGGAVPSPWSSAIPYSRRLSCDTIQHLELLFEPDAVNSAIAAICSFTCALDAIGIPSGV